MGWARKKPHQSIMCVCCISAWFVFQAVGCGRGSSSHQLAARQAPALHLCRVVQAQCMRRHVRINASSQTISPCSETVSRDCRMWLCAVFRHEGVRQRTTVRTCVHLLCGGRKVSFAFERPESALIHDIAVIHDTRHDTGHTVQLSRALGHTATASRSVVLPNRGVLPAMRQLLRFLAEALFLFGRCVALRPACPVGS
jgi:hypothetical protein